jgi:hypothetical protein
MRIDSDFELVTTPSADWHWARVEEAARKLHVARSQIFLWISEGLIRSSVLRRKGKKRGTRYIDMSSLNDLLSRNATGGRKAK